MRRISLLLGLVALGYNSIGHASGLPDTVAACRNIDDSLLRLVCYDQAVDALNLVKEPASAAPAAKVEVKPAVEISQPVAPQVEAVAAEAPSVVVPTAVDDSFGQEHLRNKTKEQQDKKSERFDSKVVKVRKNAHKKKTVTLANGQVWKMTEKQLRIKAGDAIYISRGILNSYFIGKPDSNKRVRVKRLK